MENTDTVSAIQEQIELYKNELQTRKYTFGDPSHLDILCTWLPSFIKIHKTLMRAYKKHEFDTIIRQFPAYQRMYWKIDELYYKNRKI